VHKFIYFYAMKFTIWWFLLAYPIQWEQAFQNNDFVTFWSCHMPWQIKFFETYHKANDKVSCKSTPMILVCMTNLVGGTSFHLFKKWGIRILINLEMFLQCRIGKLIFIKYFQFSLSSIKMPLLHVCNHCTLL